MRSSLNTHLICLLRCEIQP